MMFGKNDTNFKGESLCKSCKHGMFETEMGYPMYFCSKDNTRYHDVGVCKDYEDIKK